jgi:hypothetical protein
LKQRFIDRCFPGVRAVVDQARGGVEGEPLERFVAGQSVGILAIDATADQSGAEITIDSRLKAPATGERCQERAA